MAGSLTALMVGLPALRIRGLFLGVTTLAFAVPLSTFFLNPANFPDLIPTQVERPLLLDRFDLYDERTLYWFALTILAGAIVLVAGIRHSRAGRAMLAVRDNERAAQARGLSPTRIKLMCFAISGALAGLAGSLHVIALDGVRAGTYSPNMAFEAFSMVVLGGATSMSGALLGAVCLRLAQYYLSGGLADVHHRRRRAARAARCCPGGLAQILNAVRGWYFRLVARLRSITLAGPGGETGATEVDLAGIGDRLGGPGSLNAPPPDPASAPGDRTKPARAT